jgi:hypothetical protein
MAGSSGCVEYGVGHGAVINAAFNMARTLRHGMARQQQAEARRLDEAIWKNFKELGYGG